MNKRERNVAIEFTSETGWLTHYCESCCIWSICCPDCGAASCEWRNPCCNRYATAVTIAEEELEAKIREVKA